MPVPSATRLLKTVASTVGYQQSARDTGLLFLAIICAISFSSQIAMAGDAHFLSKISPHISLNQNTPSQELQSFSMSKNHPVDEYVAPGGDYASPTPKSMSDQDLFSLALGARFQISDWLGIGAACTMPLAEEETVGTEDLSIEAMVTMHF